MAKQVVHSLTWNQLGVQTTEICNAVHSLELFMFYIAAQCNTGCCDDQHCYAIILQSLDRYDSPAKERGQTSLGRLVGLKSVPR